MHAQSRNYRCILAFARQLSFRLKLRSALIVTALLLVQIPDNARALNAYITDQVSGNVSVVDTSTNTISATITVGSGPSGAAVTPDGTRVYVANHTNPGTVS